MNTVPPKDPLQILKAVTDKFVKQGYADGLRRAARLVAIAVGALSAEERLKLSATLDQLEEEIEVAEAAARA
jgi:hypothetical protein